MRARIKPGCSKTQVFAARGLLFVRDAWTDFPSQYAGQIREHPYLEIEPEAEPEQPAEMVQSHARRKGKGR